MNFALSVLNGDASETIDDNLTYLSAVLQIPITENLRYVLQHDNGWQAHVTDAEGMAGWYSIVQYLTWQVSEKLGIGIRTEWFRDQSERCFLWNNGHGVLCGNSGIELETHEMAGSPARSSI
jgi:hypothetical protein